MKNLKKRDPHQTLRIQAKIDVFIKHNKQKQQQTSNNERPKNITNRGFGFLLGDQKSSEMMTFSKHENVDFIL